MPLPVQTPRTAAAAQAGIELVEALYAYERTDPRQLQLVPNERYKVLSKDRSGWWVGENNKGEVGIFPSNYVRTIQTLQPKEENSASTTVLATPRGSLGPSSAAAAAAANASQAQTPASATTPAGSSGAVFRQPKQYDPNKASEDKQKKEEMAKSLGLSINVEKLDEQDQDNTELDAVAPAGSENDSSEAATPRSNDAIAQMQEQMKQIEQERSTAQQDAEKAKEEARRNAKQVELEKRKYVVLQKALDDAKRQKSVLEKELLTFKGSAGLIDEEERKRLIDEMSNRESKTDETQVLMMREELEVQKKTIEELTKEKEDIFLQLEQKKLELQVAQFEKMNAASAAAKGGKTAPTVAGKKGAVPVGKAGAKGSASSTPSTPPVSDAIVMQLQEEILNLKKQMLQKDKDILALQQQLKAASNGAAPEPAIVSTPVSTPATPSTPSVSSAQNSANEEKLKEAEKTVQQLRTQLEQQKAQFEQKLKEELAREAKRQQELLAKNQKKEDGLSLQIRKLRNAIKRLNEQRVEYRKQVQTQLQNFSKNELARIQTEAIKPLLATVQEINDKYKKESKARRELFNQIQELKGNIRVYVRVRPPMEKDEIVVKVNSDLNELCIFDKAHDKNQQYEFERVFGPSSTQAQVFEDVEPLATSVLDGYNVCIFAYGQTGSGKTHTMEGPQHDRGVNYRTVNELFRIRKDRADDYDIRIRVSVLEIYNENVIDLLNDDRPQLNIQLSGKTVVVQGLTTMEAKSSEDVIQILNRGYKNRVVASNNYNEHSSRSHCIVSIYTDIVSRVTNQKYAGKLHLIDLAGSERLKKTDTKGDRLQESININKSLSSLGDVISALSNKSGHVPFRNSKLTSFLQDSLGGNSKTLMFVNVSPTGLNASESICSLNFAARVRKVELGKAEKNTVN